MQATMTSQRNTIIYKFGVRLSRAEAFNFDVKNGNTKWQDDIALELDQLDEYDAFVDEGKLVHVPQGYKRINYHFYLFKITVNKIYDTRRFLWWEASYIYIPVSYH